jgi:5'-methylthioadenosine phosphorylase
MTNLQEAKLAREAEICYATLALVTDYDCWKMDEEPVTVEAVLDHLRRNSETAQRVLRAALRALPEPRGCPCPEALSNSILTARERIPAGTRRRLALLLDRALA